MTYNFGTQSLIELGTALAAVSVIGILWKHRKTGEVKYLIYLELMVAIWALTYAFEFGTTDLSLKILWSQLSYLGIAFLPLSYFLFTTAFSQRHKFLTSKNIILLSVIPAATLVLALTNDYHRLIWTNVTHNPELNMANYEHGIAFWIFYVYAQGLFVAGIYNLFNSVYRFTAYYRSQITMLIVASVIPIIGNIVYITGLNPFPGFDWTPVSFVLTGIIVGIGVFKLKLFELMPLAKNKLIDTMQNGVIVVNAEGFIEDFNPAIKAIFGISKKTAIKNPVQKVFKDFEPFLKGLEQENEHSLDFQIGYNGRTAYYHTKVTPIYGKNKKLSGKLITVNDITSLRKAELKLKNTNKQLVSEIKKNEKLIEELDSFAHTVAHDLKNSLGSIYSSSEVILESIEDGNKEFIKELSKLVKETAGKTIQVTNELLKMATAGHHDVQKVPFDMRSVFVQALQQVNGLAEQYDAKITEPKNWLNAVGYAPWVEEVWTNYITNAIKYGGEPPVISVGCEPLNGNMVKYWISDNGDGISPGNKNKIFKKHTRLNPEKAFGYGLGLSIVKRIIEKLNGTVGFESSGKKGEGSVFYFTLPAK